MGLLSQGTPLAWADAQRYADHVRAHGVRQFLATYHRHKHAGRRGVLRWGDEVEYMLLHLDDAGHNATLALRGYDVLTELQRAEQDAQGAPVPTLWRPEYARYMLEGTPGSPYGLKADELLEVEQNMRLRRTEAAKFLPENEFLASITCFPRLGARDALPFLHPHVDMNDGTDHAKASRSLFVPDEAINPHPRFATLTANIRERRQSKVAINMPIYKDVKTPSPFREPGLEDVYREGPAKDDHIYMDAMCFGMGCSCLQLTLQASHMCEARHLYDQLGVLAPIMLALTASSPIFRGYLADVDCRWDVIAASVDDRTPAERSQAPAAPRTVQQWNSEKQAYEDVVKTPRRIAKSRYDSISTYLSTHPSFRPEYNDLDIQVDADIEAQLKADGVDPLLARHIAHLFIRDPLVIYRELLDQDDTKVTDHFENIQSTNWQTMRFKPPPLSGNSEELGWRVEFRSMEVQLTDFENAAFSVFVVLLSRLILCLNLDLYMPLSKVDENMMRAQKRDAVLRERFWFRRVIFDVAADAQREERRRQRFEARQKQQQQQQQQQQQHHQPTPPADSTPQHQNGSPCNGADSPGNTTTAALDGEHDGSECCGCSSFAQRSRSNSPLRLLQKASSSASGSPPESPPPGGSVDDVRRPMSPTLSDGSVTSDHDAAQHTYAEFTLNDIINGKPGEFTGLMPMTRAFLDTLVVSKPVRAQVDKYLDFIADRAACHVATTANWMRNYVHAHPEYQGDSRVSPRIVYDLITTIRECTSRDEPIRAAPVSR